jgi:hypothetical protein
MSNLISDLEKAIFSSAIDDLHDTLSRPITVWLKSLTENTVLDSNFDAFYDKPSLNTSYTWVSGVFPARVKYLDKQDLDFSISFAARQQNQIELKQVFRVARIKVKKDAADYIDKCEKITLDGADFYVITSSNDHGLFSPNYFTYYLKSIE